MSGSKGEHAAAKSLSVRDEDVTAPRGRVVENNEAPQQRVRLFGVDLNVAPDGSAVPVEDNARPFRILSVVLGLLVLGAAIFGVMQMTRAQDTHLELTKANESINQAKTTMDAMSQQLQATMIQSKKLEADKAKLSQQLQEKTTELEACAKKGGKRR